MPTKHHHHASAAATRWYWWFYKSLDVYLLWTFLMWLFVLSLLVSHVYLMCRGLTARELRLIHDVDKISGSPASTGRRKRRRPTYLTESGINLLAYDQMYRNVLYMLFPRSQTLMAPAGDGKSDGRRVADMIDRQGCEAYCYNLRDIAKLKLARKKRMK